MAVDAWRTMDLGVRARRPTASVGRGGRRLCSWFNDPAGRYLAVMYTRGARHCRALPPMGVFQNALKVTAGPTLRRGSESAGSGELSGCLAWWTLVPLGPVGSTAATAIMQGLTLKFRVGFPGTQSVLDSNHSGAMPRGFNLIPESPGTGTEKRRGRSQQAFWASAQDVTLGRSGPQNKYAPGRSAKAEPAWLLGMSRYSLHGAAPVRIPNSRPYKVGQGLMNRSIFSAGQSRSAVCRGLSPTCWQAYRSDDSEAIPPLGSCGRHPETR